jgi:four helix bundle protein
MFFQLEERTFQFALCVRKFCRKLKQDRINLVDITQLIRASGSIGSNYIEANENLGKGDKRMHVKIARKESKECSYWLRLLFIEGDNLELENERRLLIDEVTQFRKIFSAILEKLPI